MLLGLAGGQAYSASPITIAQASDQGDAVAKTAHLNGQIVGIDYSRGTLVLQTSSGKENITVLPSTNIFRGGNSFGSLSDLVRGVHVEVFASRSGDRLIAQIIRIH